MITDGLHEAIISEKLFYKVQSVLVGRAKKNNHPKVHKVNANFPLRGFLICPRCGKLLTASFSKGNGGKYAYYHCTKGCRERITASYVNISFNKLLEQFKFKDGIKDLFKKILLDKIQQSDVDKGNRLKKVDNELDKNRGRLDRLKDMYVDGEISKEEYLQLKQKYEFEKHRLQDEKIEIRNFNKDILTQLDFCMDMVLNLSEFYEKSSIDGKQQLIGSIFTGNLIFENKKVRTTKINEVLSLITSIDRSYKKLQKEKPGKISGLSHKVNLRVLGSNQFISDLQKINVLRDFIKENKSCLKQYKIRDLIF